MWTAREEGWEKDERCVKEERDAVGVMIESSYSLVRLAALCVCVCVCSVTFLQVCAYVWVGVEVCTFQSTSVFTCVHVCGHDYVFPCVCVLLDVLILHPVYIQLGQITLLSNDHITTIMYFWFRLLCAIFSSYSPTWFFLQLFNWPLCFMNPLSYKIWLTEFCLDYAHQQGLQPSKDDIVLLQSSQRVTGTNISEVCNRIQSTLIY